MGGEGIQTPPLSRPVLFRGNRPATVDAKGRLKVPADFLALLNEHYGAEVFVTSLDGECALIYPMPVWREIEERLRTRGDLDPIKRKFMDQVGYYGLDAELDAQGRVLIPQRLRARANTLGKVDVLGKDRYLEAWNHETLQSRIETNRLTDEERAVLAREVGI